MKNRKRLQPVRANPSVCWLCDRKLDAGGWSYAMVRDEHSGWQPAHVGCVRERNRGDA